MATDLMFSLGLDAKQVQESLRQVARAVEATTAPLQSVKVKADTSQVQGQIKKLINEVNSTPISIDIDEKSILNDLKKVQEQAENIEVVYRASSKSLDKLKTEIDNKLQQATVNIDINSDINIELDAAQRSYKQLADIAKGTFTTINTEAAKTNTLSDELAQGVKKYETALGGAETVAKQLGKTITSIDKTLNVDVQVEGTRDVERLSREFDELEINARKRVDEIKSALAKLAVEGKQGSDEFNRMEKELLEAAQAAKKIDQAIKDIDKNIDIKINSNTQETKTAFDDLLGGLSGKLSEVTGVDLSGLVGSFGAAGGAAGGFAGALGSIAASINPVTLGIGAAVTAAGFLVVEFGKAVAAGAELNNALLNLQAATGASTEELGVLKNEAKELFLAGVGGSVAEATNELRTLRNTLKGLVDDDQLGEIGGQLNALGGLYDKTGSELASSLKNIMANFGVSADEAFNILSAGLKNAKTPADDFLDSINEYSQILAQNGVSVEQFYGAVAAGSEAGAFNTDKIADALKEAALRLQGGDVAKTFDEIVTSSEQAGKALPDFLRATFEESLNAFNNAEIGAGDFVAKTSASIDKALQEGQITDVIARQLQVAVAGTPAEDLGNQYSVAFTKGLNFEGVQAELTKAGEDAQKAVGQYDIFSNLQRKYQAFLETFGQSVFAFINEIAGPILTPIAGFIEFLGTEIADVFGGVFSQGGDILQGIAETVGKIIEVFAKVGSAITTSLTAPFKILFTLGSAVVDLISTLVGAFFDFGEQVDDSRSGIEKFFDGLTTVVGWVADAINLVVVGIQEATNFTRDLLSGIIGGLKPVAEFIGGTLGAAFGILFDAAKSVASFLSNAFTSAVNIVRGILIELNDRAIQPVINFLGNLADTLKGAVIDAWNVLVGAVESAKNAIGSAIDFLINTFNSFTAGAGNFFAPIIDFINSIISGAKEALEFVGSIVDAIGSVFGALEEKGANAGKTANELDKVKKKESEITKEKEKQNKQNKQAVEDQFAQLSGAQIYSQLLGNVNKLKTQGSKLSADEFNKTKSSVENALKNSTVLGKLTQDQFKAVQDALGSIGKTGGAETKKAAETVDDLKKKLAQLRLEGKEGTKEYASTLLKVKELTKAQEALVAAQQSVAWDLAYDEYKTLLDRAYKYVDSISFDPFKVNIERSAQTLERQKSELVARINNLREQIGDLEINGKIDTAEFGKLFDEIKAAESQLVRLDEKISNLGRNSEIKLDIVPPAEAEVGEYFTVLGDLSKAFSTSLADSFKPVDDGTKEALQAKKEQLENDSKALKDKLLADEISWDDYKNEVASIQKDMAEADKEYNQQRADIFTNGALALSNSLNVVMELYMSNMDTIIAETNETITKLQENLDESLLNVSDLWNVSMDQLVELSEAAIVSAGAAFTQALVEGENAGNALLLSLVSSLEKAIALLTPTITAQFISWLGPAGIPAAAVAIGGILAAFNAAKGAIGGAEEGYNPSGNKGYGKKGASDTELIWVNPKEAILTAEMTKRNQDLIDFWFKGGTTEQYYASKFAQPVVMNSHNYDIARLSNKIDKLADRIGNSQREHIGAFKHEFGEMRMNGGDMVSTVQKTLTRKIRWH